MPAQRMSRFISMVSLAAVVFLAAFIVAPAETSRSVQPDSLSASKLMVIENAGQFDSQARFLVVTGGGRLWLGQNALWIQRLTAPEDSNSKSSGRPDNAGDPAPRQGVNLRLAFPGGANNPDIQPFDLQPVHISYLLGEPEQWRTDVPVWGGVRYMDVYPGVDLVVDSQNLTALDYGLPWRIEADPGADLSALRLRLEGAESLTVDRGVLHVQTALGVIDLPGLVDAGLVGLSLERSEASPVTLSADAQGGIEISLDQLVAPTSEAVLAPTGAADLIYSTFLGGGNLEAANAVTVDSSGAAYITGWAISTDFPATPGPYATHQGAIDAFVSKLDPSGSALVYSCMIGGLDLDRSYSIDVSGGVAEIAGGTLSTDFPTTVNAYDASCGTDGACNAGGQGPYTDAFLVRVNETCTALTYSTYLGGEKEDSAYGLVAENGSTYLTGVTESGDFPGQGYVGDMDAFGVKFNSQGGLAYSRMVGGRDTDAGFSIDVQSGSAYIVGETFSSNFPANGYAGGRDAFVVKLDPAGALIPSFSKLIGGSLDERANSVKVGANGDVFTIGWTNSINLPVTESSFHGGIYDAFLFRLSSSASTTYATYLGGSGLDVADDIVLDGLGGIYLTGRTASTDFPITSDSYQPLYQGGTSDAFIIRYDLTGGFPANISYASYLGGQAEDSAYGLGIDPAWHVYLTGFTKSSDFPTSESAYDRLLNGQQDAFITKMVVGPLPSIDIEKYTNGEDADLPPGPYILGGSPVNWSYVVTNNGRTVLNAVSVTDNRGLPVNCPKNSLAINESMTCTASAAATLGQYSNNATATGSSPLGYSVSDSDLSHYFGANPVINLVKKTNDQDANAPAGVFILSGDLVIWTYELANAGNVSLANVVVRDDNGTPANGADDVTVCNVASLEAGSAYTCSRQGVAGPGQYANTGTVTADPPGGLASITDTDISHYFGVNAGIRLVKKTNEQDANQAPGPFILMGGSVQWSYDVTNTGNVALANITVTDDNGTSANSSDDVLVCTITALAVNQTQTCARPGTAIAGQYSNRAVALGIPPVGPSVTSGDLSHYFGAVPGLDLSKKINQIDANAPPGPSILAGQSIEWTYVLSNTGNVTLSNIVVRDDNGTPANPGDDFDACTVELLPPSVQHTCARPGTAVVGQYTNIAVASAAPPVGPAIGDTDSSSYFGVNPAISLEKRTNGEAADSPTGPNILAGGTVNWLYEVQNTGNVVLSNVVIEDDAGTPSNSGDDVLVCTIPSLLVGASQSCSRTGTAIVGQYVNVGRVRGTPPTGSNVSATDPSHYFGANPQVRVENLTNGVDADNPTGPVVLIGSTLTWTYQVFNDGNISLNNLSVSDDNGTPSDPADDLQVCQISSLAAGATQSCTRSSQAVAGQHVNIASVSGTPPVGGTVSDTDPSHYYGARAGLSLIKRTNTQDANQPPGPYVLVGGAVSWRYDLTNTGEVDLSGVSITDDNGTPAIPADDYICNISTLSAGASQSCVKTGVAQTGQYANTARAVGSYAGTQISVTDPSHYFGANPAIQLDQRINQQETTSPPGLYFLVGESLTWSYQVTNAGNVNLTNVTITDDNGTPGVLTDDLPVCTITSLPVGATQPCSRQETASAGQHANQGRAVGTPPGGLSAVSALDMGYYFGASPGLSLEKKTNTLEADSPPGPYLLAGSSVSWTFDLVNTGNVPLTALTVTDNNGTPDIPTDDLAVCTLDELAVGDSYSCLLTGTAQPGQYGNLGRTTGTPPGGLLPVSATDMSHYFGAQPGISLTKTTQGSDADSPPGPAILEGGTVTWDYDIQNTGNVVLTNIRVRDDNGTPTIPLDDFNVCTLASLAVGAAHSCTRNGTASPGQYTNVGTALGKPPGSIPDVRTTDPSNYFGEAPSVRLIKATNGQDANTPPGPVVLVGNPVEWTFTVVNDGNVALTDIVVIDDNGTPANPVDDRPVCTINSLPVGETEVCSLTGSAETGQYANLGSLTAQAPQGPLLTATDTSHYYGAPPGIGLLIFTNGQAAIDPPGPYLLVDDPITWTYEVINTGEVDLFNVSVVDDHGTPTDITDDQTACTYDSLPAGESRTCTLAGFAASGQYTNTAVASGTPQDGSTIAGTAVGHYFGIVPAIELKKQTNHADADLIPGPYIPVGDPVTWSYIITNAGNVTLRDLTVRDDNGTPATPGDDLTVCTLTSLGPAASRTCTLSGVAAAGQYANLGTVTGNPPVGPAVEDSDPAHYFGANSHMSLEKRTNGSEADSAPGPYILVGSTVDWSYEVKNEGNVALSDITVRDDNGTPLDGSDDVTFCNIPSLAAGESQLCSRSGIALPGQYVNVAEASGTPPGGLAVVSVSDAAHYFGAAPQIDLQKLTNRQDADTPPGPYILVGAPAQWVYEITNTGNVPLTSLTITDDQGTPGDTGDDWSCALATLAVGATRSCEHSLPAVAGQYSNTAVASGTPPGGLAAVTDQDTSHYFGASPAIQLQKMTNNLDVSAPPGPVILQGEPVEWRYIVSNSGNTTLTNIQVTDDQLESVACPQASLEPGNQMTCTAQGAASSGQYSNLGSASGTPPGGLLSVNANDSSYYFGAAPSLRLVSLANSDDANNPPGPYILAGQTVTQTFEVSNNGNIDLVNVVIKEDNGTPADPSDDHDICTIPALAVGTSSACQRLVTSLPGQQTWTGSASGATEQGFQVSDQDPAYYFGEQPRIDLEKLTNGQDADDLPGPTILVNDPVTWSYQVSNTGNIALRNVVVEDDNGTAQDTTDDVIICVIANLNAGQSQSCLRLGSAVPGPYANLGSVEAASISGLVSVTDQDWSHYYGGSPGIALRKTIAGQDADAPPGPYILTGDDLTWEYEVSNTGNIPLNAITVSDDHGTPQDTSDDVPVCEIATLAPGAEAHCSMNDQATPGQYVNTGTASATPTVGPGITTTDLGHYFGAVPSIALEKDTNGQEADGPPGPYLYVAGAVEWTYTVTNTGNVALSDIQISDDNGTPSNSVDDWQVCQIDSLLPGGEQVCTASDTVTIGQYSNSGTATGIPPGGLASVSAVDLSHYFGSQPGIELVKRTNGEDANSSPGPSILAGDPVNWTYEVTNTGNVPLTLVAVSDDQGVQVSCPLAALSPSQAMTCTANGVAESGQYRNVGTVEAVPPAGLNLLRDSDLSHYLGYTNEPAVDLMKMTRGEDANTPPGPYLEVGAQVSWDYRITNIGNVPLSNLSVIDDAGTPSDTEDDIPVCSLSSLAVGAAHTCSSSGTVQLGQYVNHATVSADAPGADSVSSTDLSHYFGGQPGIRLAKRVNGLEADTAPGPYVLTGSLVLWTYEVENTGNVDLTTIRVLDDHGTPGDPADDISVCTFGSLAPGASDSCSISGPAANGQQAGNGVATGTPPGGLADANDTDAGYYFGAQPSLLLIKRTNGEDADTAPGPIILNGETVNWSYLLFNNGNVALSNIVVLDDPGTSVNPQDDRRVCTIASLQPGFSQTCYLTGVAAPGQYMNTGQATASPPGVLSAVQASDVSHYFGADPAVQLTKRVNGLHAPTPPGPTLISGEDVTWTYQISNTGNVELTDLEVIDDNGTPNDTADDFQVCSLAVLAAGAGDTCEWSGLVVDGPYGNTALVTAAYDGQISDTDTSYYTGTPPFRKIFLPLILLHSR